MAGKSRYGKEFQEKELRLLGGIVCESFVGDEGRGLGRAEPRNIVGDAAQVEEQGRPGDRCAVRRRPPPAYSRRPARSAIRTTTRWRSARTTRTSAIRSGATSRTGRSASWNTRRCAGCRGTTRNACTPCWDTGRHRT